jgi:hypothetical protein
MASTRFTAEYEPNAGDVNVFINFVKFVDTGVYKCRAENVHGYDETFMNMCVVDMPSVDERPQTQNPGVFASFDMPLGGPHASGQVPSPSLQEALNPQPPLVVVPLTDAIIMEERPTFLACKIIGSPRPKVACRPGRPCSASVVFRVFVIQWWNINI